MTTRPKLPTPPRSVFDVFAPLKCEMWPIERLKPDPQNPRAHSPHQIRQIQRSMQAFGFLVPVLATKEGRPLAGHGRIRAARNLGMDSVPVIQVDHLSPAQIKAFQVADNKLAENATWDQNLLRDQFIEILAADPTFEIELTGFDMGEIDLCIGQDVGSKPDAADDVPALGGRPVSALGDVWLLGKHRLLCADALSGSNYVELMAGQRAVAVVTDPPYNLAVKSITGNGAIKHREFAMAVGEMDRAEFTAFLSKILGHLRDHSREGSIHFIFMDWRHALELMQATQGIYTELKNICVWVKDSGGMGSMYRNQTEFVFVYKNGRASHRNNIQLGKHGRNRTNVWRYTSPAAFGRTSEEGKLLALHPTVKPVQLVADAILDVTSRGQIVLDPFLGSGTTLMAAQRTGRICHGIELDPLYVDTAIRRWQAFTGDEAIHAESSRTFNQVEAEVTRG